MRDSAPHILIVDDDPSIREGLALAFKDTYVVHAAATGAGNVTQQTNPLNQTWAFTYDPVFNQPLTVTDPLTEATRFTYGSKGNLTGVTDPMGHSTTFAYNQFGQPVSVTDALGRTTAYEYDNVGNLIAAIDPMGNRTERTHDALSRLIAIKDPRGLMTRYAYDALDRLVTITDALGGRTSFTYDPMGNVLTVTDARGNTTTHAYDGMNRLMTRTDPLGRRESYTYDLNGNLRTITDRKGQLTSHSYDPQNRRIRSDYTDGTFVTYEYDTSGRLLAATDSQTGTITNTYDPIGRLTSQVTPQGAITYTYDALGRRQRLEVNGLLPVEYQYDANSRLMQIQQGGQTVTLAYDAANRRTIITLPNGVTTTYAYDAASRLTALTYAGPNGPHGDLTYIYDATGNRIAVGGSWARTGIPTSISTGDYDAANQQVSFGPITQAFDANGNLLSQTDATGTTTYTWDARDRLIRINGPTISASFAYDALSRRIAKTIDGVATAFHYDGADIVRESGSAGDAAYLRTLAIDDVLARVGASSTNYYLVDGLRSVLGLVNESGTLGTLYSYEPFGRQSELGSEGGGSFGYSGRERDTPLLYFFRNRYYSPLTSRFLQEDRFAALASDVRGLNRYLYVYDNPVRYADPLGLYTIAAGVQAQENAPGLGSSQSVSVAADTKGNVATVETLEGGGAVSVPLPYGLSGGLQVQVTTASDVAALSQWSVVAGGSVTLPIPLGPGFLSLGLEWVGGSSYHGLNVNVGLGTSPGVELHSFASYAWVEKLFNIADLLNWLQRGAAQAPPRPSCPR